VKLFGKPFKKICAIKMTSTFILAFFFQNCSPTSGVNTDNYAQYEGIANTISLSSTKAKSQN